MPPSSAASVPPAPAAAPLEAPADVFGHQQLRRGCRKVGLIRTDVREIASDEHECNKDAQVQGQRREVFFRKSSGMIPHASCMPENGKRGGTGRGCSSHYLCFNSPNSYACQIKWYTLSKK